MGMSLCGGNLANELLARCNARIEGARSASAARRVFAAKRDAIEEEVCVAGSSESHIEVLQAEGLCWRRVVSSRFGYFRAIKADRRYYADMGHVVRGTSSQSAATAAAAAVRACR